MWFNIIEDPNNTNIYILRSWIKKNLLVMQNPSVDQLIDELTNHFGSS